MNVFRKLQEAAISEFEKRDVNYYLILLNHIYELRDDEIAKLKALKHSDFLVVSGDERFLSRRLENSVRIKMFLNKTFGAMEKFSSCKNR